MTTNTHALVAETRDPWTKSAGAQVKLDEYPSYDDALIAWQAASELVDQFPDVIEYRVRATDDPSVVTRYGERPEKHFNRARVSAALREAHRKEVGATARATLDVAPEGRSLGRVILDAKESLRARGIKVERWEVEDAVKRRVTLGRCHSHGRTRRAFWVKKSEGPL